MAINSYPVREKEIVTPINLCRENGTLNPESIGWAKNPLYSCNLKGSWLRKKKWNYWCIMSPDCLFSATISNIDYVGMVFIYFLDFKTKTFMEKTIKSPLGIGCEMPPMVNSTVTFKNGSLSLSMIDEEDGTHILCKTRDFNGRSLNVDFKASQPKEHETLNVVIPWSDNRFQFTSKQECLPVNGSLKLEDQVYQFEPSNTFAVLDYGRGIWPYQSSWNWANGSGISNNQKIGFNLGGTWTDGTGMTENALVVDGKLTKISDDLNFSFDKSNLMEPWAIKTKSTDQVDLIFFPFFERIAKSNLLLVKSNIHQMIGYFSGSIKTTDGQPIRIENIWGSTEDHHARW
ncbi:MAG: DUF2804 domain-containing protein [Clostridiaceae bacterium]